MRLAASCLLLAAVTLVATDVRPQTPPGDVRIDITTQQTKRLPIRLESLVAAGGGDVRTGAVSATDVLANDLTTSAVFAVSRPTDVTAAAEPPQAVVGGTWTLSGGQVRLSGEVRDFPGRRPILQKEYRGPVTEWRDLVHRFADDVVLQFTGEPGVARTRIAFATQQGRDKELVVMDADGANLRAITSDHSIARSPAWSPDGSLIAFTSYRGGHGPKLYVTTPANRKIYTLSTRPGINTAASYSPDGRDIVCTLSQDGNAEIYLLDARGGTPRRLTNQRAIDTSPCWSPTGQEIAFTSDRSGAPQVYVMDRGGGNVRRLNYDVNYTDSPSWSPRGDRIAFVSRSGAGFDVYLCRPDGAGTQLVVSGGNNENPRWSPDGRHIVFASDRDGAFALYVSDLDGTPPRRLDTGGRKALSPAWSPRTPAGPAPN